MREALATVLELAGVCFFIVAGYVVHPALALLVAGVACFAMAYAMERNG